RFAWWPRRASRTKVRNPRRGSFRNVTHKYFTHTQAGFVRACFLIAATFHNFFWLRKLEIHSLFLKKRVYKHIFHCIPIGLLRILIE
ncbi:hypothetical protein, partial [Geobacillus sp. YHL]|uniref:hypothetical protein n=1 Tax=Geobacillus sp. YHL TaxID=2796117 RepID=UPI001EF032DA